MLLSCTAAVATAAAVEGGSAASGSAQVSHFKSSIQTNILAAGAFDHGGVLTPSLARRSLLATPIPTKVVAGHPPAGPVRTSAMAAIKVPTKAPTKAKVATGVKVPTKVPTATKGTAAPVKVTLAARVPTKMPTGAKVPTKKVPTKKRPTRKCVSCMLSVCSLVSICERLVRRAHEGN